jgi:mRNA deadenylase 3'-5' endonuclease subunit Ccr4
MMTLKSLFDAIWPMELKNARQASRLSEYIFQYPCSYGYIGYLNTNSPTIPPLGKFKIDKCAYVSGCKL